MCTGLNKSRGVPESLIEAFPNAKIGGEVDFPTSSKRNGPNASGPTDLASGSAEIHIRTRRPRAQPEGRWRVWLGRPSPRPGGQLGPKSRKARPSLRKL
jgi:hypothetical protein